jgi:hypothetical protein
LDWGKDVLVRPSAGCAGPRCFEQAPEKRLTAGAGTEPTEKRINCARGQAAIYGRIKLGLGSDETPDHLCPSQQLSNFRCSHRLRFGKEFVLYRGDSTVAGLRLVDVS